MSARKKAGMTRHPYLSLFWAMAIAGSGVVVGKMLISGMPTFLAIEIGLGIGLLCLIPVSLVRKERIPHGAKNHLALVVQALFGIVAYRLFTFWGLHYTSATEAGLIASVTPAVIAVLSWLFLKERIARKTIAGIMSVVVGLTIIGVMPMIGGASDSMGSIGG